MNNNDPLFKFMNFVLSENITRAKNGDALAAQDALGMIVSMFEAYRKGDKVVLPSCVADYLLCALNKILAGEDGRKAFNLKKPGPKKWRHQEKMSAAYLMRKLMDGGKSVLDASESASEMLKKLDAAGYRRMKKIPDGSTIQSWYYELKDEVEEAVAILRDL
jgi:hypothetical protein